MGSTDPLTGTRFPYGSDAATIAQYIENAVRDMADDTIPPFASAAARDAAFNAWVNSGRTMRDGLHCVVAGIDQVYRGGVWRGIGYSPVLVGAIGGPYTVPVGDTDPRLVGLINVPDPGWPYRLRTYGAIEVIGVNARADMVFDINGTRWGYVPGMTQYIASADVSPVFTGAQSLRMYVYRATGTGTWTNTSNNWRMTAEVVPA